MSASKTARRRQAHQPRRLRPIPLQSNDRVGKLNTYRCDAGHTTTTVDRDPGVTPSSTLCRHTEARGFPAVTIECDLRAVSSFYNAPPGAEPTFEWYRPDDPGRRTLNPYQADHVNMGGLLLRPIDPTNPPTLCSCRQRHDGRGRAMAADTAGCPIHHEATP